MNKKIIATGNMIMCDDGIGIKVAEHLYNEFRLIGFETIIGESNIEYSINRIEDGDSIIILTSSYFDIEPGTINITPVEMVTFDPIHFSQETLSLLKLLNEQEKSVSVILISFEASELYLNTDLSEKLKIKFDDICKQCLNVLRSVLIEK